jgi:hypothetical protein
MAEKVVGVVVQGQRLGKWCMIMKRYEDDEDGMKHIVTNE